MRKNSHKQNQRTSKQNFLTLCSGLLLLIMTLHFGCPCLYARTETTPVGLPQSSTSEIPINLTSITQITFAQNPDVASTRYALEAAEFQFKDFERNLSQFTPLLFRSSIERDVRHPDETQEYKVQAGMEKEFFDGSSVFAGVGNRGEFGNLDSGGGQFLEMDIQFPLLGSNTTLRRITERSREENEMHNARLEYIDIIRETIQNAQIDYFMLLVSMERTSAIVKCISDYEEIIATARAQSNPVERRQVEDEIQALQSEILQSEDTTKSELLNLQFKLGFEHLSLSQVGRLDLYAKDYYGKSYIKRSVNELLEEARQNDIKTRVLENAKKNSIEKKRLAERGKWDIFIDLNGQWDLENSGNLRDENGYSASIGIGVRKIDSKLLRYSLRRAVAEIKKYEAQIRGQRLKTGNHINREWFLAQNRRKGCEELFESVDSRGEIYLQKRKYYVEGNETIDNLITSRKNLLESEKSLIERLGEFYPCITRLDYACGVCFAELGIQL